MKLQSLLFKEAPRDLAGSDTFQGGPFGYGKNHQLFQPKQQKNLIDPEEEKRNQIKGPLGQNMDKLEEREASDILYRDLPGGLPMNSLENPQSFVPQDEEGIENGELEPNMSAVSLTTLIPYSKSEKYGYGPLTPAKPKFESTANNWKEVDGENILPIKQDGKFDDLVYRKNFLDDDELNPMNGFNKLNDDDDVNTRSGNMANLTAPKKFIPEPAPVYEENMKAKETKTFDDLENQKQHLPKEIDSKVKDVKGNGVGTVLNNNFAPPKNIKNESKKEKEDGEVLPNDERLQPYKYSRKTLTSPEDFTVVLEKAIDKIIENLLKKR